jgi:hypothetical protein
MGGVHITARRIVFRGLQCRLFCPLMLVTYCTESKEAAVGSDRFLHYKTPSMIIWEPVYRREDLCGQTCVMYYCDYLLNSKSDYSSSVATTARACSQSLRFQTVPRGL